MITKITVLTSFNFLSICLSLANIWGRFNLEKGKLSYYSAYFNKKLTKRTRLKLAK